MRIGGTDVANPDRYVDYPARNILLKGLQNPNEKRAEIVALLGEALFPYFNALTPEQFGAFGDGESHILNSMYNTLPDAQIDYPAAESLTDEADWAALTHCYDRARQTNRPMQAPGRYVCNKRLSLLKGNVEYWNGSTLIRPVDNFINVILTSSTDVGVRFSGSLISDRLHIGHIIGPGIGAIGTPGGVNEIIGVLLEGPVQFKLDSATDFNFGVVMQGCFSSNVEIGFVLACREGFYARVTPGDANGTNQRCNVRIRKTGGAYTSEAFPNDALRRARSCDTGIHLESMHGSVLDLGSPEYCQQESNSVAVKIAAAVTKNTIHLYLEGVRDDGEFFNCAGDDNIIYFSGLGSVSDVKIGAIRVTGIGNEIYGLGDTLGGAARAVFAPQGSYGIVQITPGNHVHGRYKQQVSKAASTLRLNLLADATAFTVNSGSLTVTTETDVPVGHDFKESYEFTVPDSGTYTYTSGNITVTGESRDIVRVKIGIRGILNHTKIAFYLMSSAGVILAAKDSITTDPNDPEWHVIEYLAKIGAGLTNIWFRYSIRNTSPGETGGKLRATRPLISYNLKGPLVRSNDIMPHENGVEGRFIPKSLLNKQGFVYEEQIVTDIVATVFDVNSRGMATCTAHPTGNSVNLINNLIEGQPTIIVNVSGSSITFTATALDSGSVVLANNQAMTVIRTTGKGAVAAKTMVI